MARELKGPLSKQFSRYMDGLKKKKEEENTKAGQIKKRVSATHQARKNISGSLTPALVRAGHITENRMDREYGSMSRKQLNEEAGHTQTQNLWNYRGKPIINYAEDEAVRRTKERNKK